MISITKVRVKYSETDHFELNGKESINYAHYTNYLNYYEQAIKDLLKRYSLTYDYLEMEGVVIPVISVDMHFKKPAFYDEIISVHAKIHEIGLTKLVIKFEVFNSDNFLINTGSTTHAIVNASSLKPISMPNWLKNFFVGTKKIIINKDIQ